jgi:AcrR family transcriptional regulator
MDTPPLGRVRVRRESGWRIERYPQTVVALDADSVEARQVALRHALDIATKHGLDGVDLDTVREAAGTTLAAFPYQEREELMLALLDVVLARTLNAEREIAAGRRERLELGDMLAAEMEGLRRQAPLVELIFSFYFARSDQLYRARIGEALSTYRRAFESALAGVELRRGMTPSAVSAIVIAFLQGAAVQIIRDPANFVPDEALAAVRALLPGSGEGAREQ